MCRERLPIISFNNKKRSFDGHSSYCKKCDRKIQKGTIEKYKKINKNREVYNKSKKFCPSCNLWKIRSKENWVKDSARKDGLYAYCKVCNKSKQRIIDLKYSYNLTYEEYKKLLKNQKGRCKICGILLKRPYVDHSHKTEKIRGLLCSNCNSGLGWMRDNPFILYNAIKYLREEL